MSREWGRQESDFAYQIVASSGNLTTINDEGRPVLGSKIMCTYIFGSNDTLGLLGVTEDVWNGPTPLRGEPAAATPVTIVSTSVNDALFGTGARAVRIEGCAVIEGRDYLISEDVELSGLTPVDSAQSYISLHRIRVIDSGSSLGQIGILTASIEGKPQAVSNPEVGNIDHDRSRSTHVRIPSDYTGFVSNLYTAGGPNDDFIVSFEILEDKTNTFVSFIDLMITNSNAVFEDFRTPIGPISSGSVFKPVCQGITSNSRVRVGYNLILIRNDYLESMREYL